jgi:CBS domain-containing protein
MESNEPLERRLPISTRAVLEADGSVRRDLQVFCPKGDATIVIEGCTSCPACMGLDAKPDADGRPAVRCAFERVTPGRAARPVGAVLARYASAVRLGALPQAHAEPPCRSPVAVVDAELRLVGILEGDGTVRPDDGSLSCAVEEHVTLPTALARMARRRQRSVLVVDRVGVFVGLFDDLDALRALRDVSRA